MSTIHMDEEEHKNIKRILNQYNNQNYKPMSTPFNLLIAQNKEILNLELVEDATSKEDMLTFIEYLISFGVSPEIINKSLAAQKATISGCEYMKDLVSNPHPNKHPFFEYMSKLLHTLTS